MATKGQRTSLAVVGPDGPRPFMRGILVQSLVSRGIPFDTALETSTQIRDRLRGRGAVAPEQIEALVAECLPSEFSLEALPSPRDEVLLVRDSDGGTNPFSKGLLALSLEAAGMESADANDVARDLERVFAREGLDVIERTDLRERVASVVARKHGEGAAERYRIWRAALEGGRPVFLLVGGSSGVGKTSITVEVARRLEIARVIGTDSIRQIMRLMFSPDLMPEIHCSTYDAHEALALDVSGPADPVILGYREQALKLTVGVHGLLDRAVEENTSLAIEGVNLLPSALDLARYAPHAHVIALVVATLDPEAYRRRFSTRATKARERDADRYLKHFTEIRTIQDYILAEADHVGLPIIDNVQFDAAVRAALRSVISRLKRDIADVA